jgi:uncharacterized lipoprotein YajG
VSRKSYTASKPRWSKQFIVLNIKPNIFRTLIITIFIAILLNACSSVSHVRIDEKNINNDSSQSTIFSAPINVINAQVSEQYTTSKIHHSVKTIISFDKRDIVETFNNALKQRIISNGGKINAKAEKQIKINITNIEMTISNQPTWLPLSNGEITVKIKLGNGKTILVTGEDTSLFYFSSKETVMKKIMENCLHDILEKLIRRDDVRSYLR